MAMVSPTPQLHGCIYVAVLISPNTDQAYDGASMRIKLILILAVRFILFGYATDRSIIPIVTDNGLILVLLGSHSYLILC